MEAKLEALFRDFEYHARETVNALLAGKPVEVSQTKPYGCGVKYAN